ncbi:hypothetical protein BKA69DRAFT_1093140 [Paraphysoderma sedebokerense]|nr:hypothetical protein BKA69DRAFT_1093140 [Paraphysoderma sedebokerense]
MHRSSSFTLTCSLTLHIFLTYLAITEEKESVDETTTTTSPRSHPSSPSASPSLSPLAAASSTSDFKLEVLHIDPDSPLLQDTMPLPLILPPPSLSNSLPLPPLSKLANDDSRLMMIPSMANGKENLNVQGKSSSMLDAAVEQEVSSFESKRKSLLYGRPLPPIPQQAAVELDSSDKISGKPLAIADTTSEAMSRSVSVRLSPILERFICKLAHQKLSHPKTHLRNQVLLSNMLIWYFSISASDAASDVVDLNMSTQVPTEMSGLTDVFAKNGAPSVPVSGNFEPSDDTYTKGPDRPQPKMAVVWRNGRFRVVKPDQRADVDGISDKTENGPSSRRSRSGKRSRRKRSSHRHQNPNEPVKKVITMSGKVVYIGGSGPNSSSDSDGHHRRRKSKSKSKRYSKRSSSDSDSTSDSASPTSSSDSGSDSETDSDSDSDNEEIYTDFHSPSSSSSSDAYSFTISPKRRSTQLTQKPLLSFTKDELSSVVYDPSITDEPVDLSDDKVTTTTKEKTKEKNNLKPKTKSKPDRKLKSKKTEPKNLIVQDDEDDEVPLGLMFASKKKHERTGYP